MFNNTIKFSTFIFPIAALVIVSSLNPDNSFSIESSITIISYIAITPLLFVFIWDFTGFCIFLYQHKNKWRVWFKQAMGLHLRLGIVIFIFLGIAFGLNYLIS